MRGKKFYVLAALVLCPLTADIERAGAQDYPNQPIRIVVAASPGGPNDIVARMAAQFLGKLGQPVLVENRAGAGGALGAREVAASKPDGYTLLTGNTSTLAVIPATSASAGYDPIKSFAPVAKFWESYQILVVDPSFPAKSLSELVEYARANPGKLNYAHTGQGGLPHLTGELFKLRAGVDIVGVPYRSDGESVTAILTGSVQMTFGNMTVLLPLIREGKLRALGVTSPKRTPLAPELPSIMEAGVPDYEVTTFFGIVAPAGTPESIVQKLNGVLNDGLLATETDTIVARLGAVSTPGTPGNFAGFIAAKRQQWTDVAKAAGVKLD
jgi:tripartite-type tricarboxylate transporter receptor subunit TctC